MLFLAALASVTLHSLLLLPLPIPKMQLQQQPTPTVILAQLKQEQPKYNQIQQPNPSIAPAKESASQNTLQEVTKTIPKKEQQLQPTKKISKPKAVTPPKATEQAGLAIKQDDESVDPLEQNYQQLLLAHLRSKLIAPQEFSGEVRLSIRFSYRQIATEVKVISSSGNARVDDWAIKSVLAANPFPATPKELPDSYTFRPTLKIAP